MKKAFKRLAIVLVCGIIAMLAALPLAVPPIVERLITTSLAQGGYPASARLQLGYCWTSAGPGLKGNLRTSLLNTAWHVDGEFSLSLSRLHASVKMDETAFCERDPLCIRLLHDWPVTTVSNLTFSGSVAFRANAECSWSMPVPVWSAKLKVANVSVSGTQDGKEFSVSGLTAPLGASGIVSHVDIDPIFLRASAVRYDAYELKKPSAVIRATEKALLVNEATAELFDGTISLYSLFLDPKTLNAGFTLFIDGIDTGRILPLFPNIRGTATGRHHGKLKLFVREGGKGIRIREAFLYSVPGETGKLCLEDATAVTDNLELAGIEKDQRDNVARALTDLDYSVFRLKVDRLHEDELVLSLRIEGLATRGAVSAPVTLNLTFRGAFEQILNTGLKLSGQ